MECCGDRQEVEEHLGPQPHVFDQQSGALELALLAIRADKARAHGVERRLDRGFAKGVLHVHRLVWEADRVALQSTSLAIARCHHLSRDEMAAHLCSAKACEFLPQLEKIQGEIGFRTWKIKKNRKTEIGGKK